VRIILLRGRAIERRGKFLHFILSDLRLRKGVVADIVVIVPFKTVPIGILAAAVSPRCFSANYALDLTTK